MSLRVLFIGNFGPERSTENAYRYALQYLGHEVIPVEQRSARPEQVLMSGNIDLIVYVRTHNPTALGREWTDVWRKMEKRGALTASVHLDVFVGVQRYGLLGYDEDPLFTTGHVFTPDPLLAREIYTQHHYLPPAADVRRGDPVGEPIDSLAGKVVFVGSRYGVENMHPEYPFRAQMLDYLQHRLGDKFVWYGAGSPCGSRRGKELWDIYASDCVIVGDSCFAGARPFYWSDRVPETVAHGGFLIHPYVEGIDRDFPDMPLWTPGNLQTLDRLIDFHRGNVFERAEIRERARQHALVHHTYVTRAQQILYALYPKEMP